MVEIEQYNDVLTSGRIKKLLSTGIVIDRGEQYHVDMETYNETGDVAYRDFMLSVGHYDANEDKFVAFGNFIGWYDIPIATGYQTASLQAHGIGEGPYDILVGYGKWKGSSPNYPKFFLEDGFLILDALLVQFFELENIRLRKVPDDGHRYGIVVSPGETFHMDIDMENYYSQPATYDYLAGFGTYDDITGIFTIEEYSLDLDKTVQPGEYMVDIPCQVDVSKCYDVLGAYGHWDDATHTFSIIDYYTRFHSLIVIDNIGGGELVEAITCESVSDTGEHTPMKTLFDYNKRVWLYLKIHDNIDTYGHSLRMDWVYDGKMVDMDDGLLSEHLTDFWTYSWTYIGYLFGPGTGKIDIYLDDIYLGSTNNFTVLPRTCPYNITEAECILNGCYWYNGICNNTPQ